MHTILSIAREWFLLFCGVGVNPCRCRAFTQERCYCGRWTA